MHPIYFSLEYSPVHCDYNRLERSNPHESFGDQKIRYKLFSALAWSLLQRVQRQTSQFDLSFYLQMKLKLILFLFSI